MLACLGELRLFLSTRWRDPALSFVGMPGTRQGGWILGIFLAWRRPISHGASSGLAGASGFIQRRQRCTLIPVPPVARGGGHLYCFPWHWRRFSLCKKTGPFLTQCFVCPFSQFIQANGCFPSFS